LTEIKINAILFRLKHALELWSKKPRKILNTIGLSFLILLSGHLVGWFAVLGMKGNVDLPSWIAISVIIYFAALLPISLNGLGITEVGIVYFLGVLGVQPDKAASSAVLIRGITILVSLIGGLWILIEKRVKKRSKT